MANEYLHAFMFNLWLYYSKIDLISKVSHTSLKKREIYLWSQEKSQDLHR